MAYNGMLEQRIRQFFDAKQIKHEAKHMMGGLYRGTSNVTSLCI